LRNSIFVKNKQINKLKFIKKCYKIKKKNIKEVYKMTIGEKLKECRKNKKMTQQEVAELLNIKQATYNGYENDKHLPDIKTLIKLADIYKTSLDYITGRYK
jgi:DNA-binding XRE family transcriptional regulator